MKKERFIIEKTFEEKFSYYSHWGTFNFSLMYFDGFEYDGTSYRELDIVSSNDEFFLFTDFNEYVNNKIAGGVLFDLDNPDDKYCMFFNANGKKYGNEDIGYEWTNWSPGTVNRDGISAKRAYDGEWYFLASYGAIQRE